MKRMMAILSAWLLLLPTVCPAGQTVSRIAAVVNDDIITTHQLDQEMAERLAAEGGGKNIGAEKMEAMRRELLSKLVDDALVRQRAEKLGLKVSEEEVDAAIDDIQKQNNLSRQQLIDALQFQGMPFDAYRENMRQQVLRYKVIGREVRAKVDVTDRDVRNYFREHIDDYREEPKMRLSRITFQVPDNATEVQVDAIRKRAGEALGRLQHGEDFYTVLLSYSAEQQAEGGDMGLFAEGELTPAFDRAVRDLKEGEVSGVVKTQKGFHILQLAERIPGKIRKFDSVREEIRETLVKEKTAQRFKEWSKELREGAYIDIRL